MSSIASIMTMVAALSLTDKLQLNAQLAAQMAGGEVSIEASAAPAAKAASAKAKKPSARAGKPAAPGTKAWSAFVEHCRSTMPERFASAPPKDRMVIAKAIKDEDPEAYKAFAAKYIAEHPASEVASVASAAASDAEGSVAEKAEKAAKPKRVISDEQKAKMKAGREAAKAIKDAAKAAGETPAPKGKKAASATNAPKKAAAAPSSVGGGGSAAAAASSPSGASPIAQPVFEEDDGLVKITVDGVDYLLVTVTNNAYEQQEDGRPGAFMGRYDPATEEIDFEALEGSDE